MTAKKGPDRAHNLLQAYRFYISVKDSLFGFRSVSGLKLTSAFEPLAVGGRNDGGVLLRVPVKETGRIVFERGKYFSSRLVPFRVGYPLQEPVDVIVVNAAGEVGLTYRIAAPWLESIELSGLDASDSSIIVEKFTIVHHGVSEE